MPQNGDWGDVLFAHPRPAQLVSISLPDEPTTFSSRIALAPDSWAWGGDGVTFILQIEDESGKIEDLFRQHIGNTSEDQKWHTVLVPLADYAGRNITLTLITDSGPIRRWHR